MSYQFALPPKKIPVQLEGNLYVNRNVGRTVIRESGAWTEIEGEVVLTDRIQAAEQVLLGGYVHVVSDVTAAELGAAGFSEGLTPL